MTVVVIARIQHAVIVGKRPLHCRKRRLQLRKTCSRSRALQHAERLQNAVNLRLTRNAVHTVD